MTVEKISDAYALAALMHRSQTDKLGKPYLYHCHVVAEAVRERGADYEIVGVLHDIVEDTPCTLVEIKQKFGDIVRQGVDAMTRRDDEDYFQDYLPRLKQNEIACVVKLEDAKHNLARSSQIDDLGKRQKLREKYREVIVYLGGVPPECNETLE